MSLDNFCRRSILVYVFQHSTYLLSFNFHNHILIKLIYKAKHTALLLKNLTNAKKKNCYFPHSSYLPSLNSHNPILINLIYKQNNVKKPRNKLFACALAQKMSLVHQEQRTSLAYVTAAPRLLADATCLDPFSLFATVLNNSLLKIWLALLNWIAATLFSA